MSNVKLNIHVQPVDIDHIYTYTHSNADYVQSDANSTNVEDC